MSAASGSDLLSGLELRSRRETMIRGEPIAMGNGEAWQIPCLAFIPRTIKFSKTTDGKPVVAALEPPAAQMELFGRIGKLFDAMHDAAKSGNEATFDFAEAAGVCFELLAMNYAITVDLANAAGLIRESDIIPVLLAAWGLKKNDPVPSAPQSG